MTAGEIAERFEMSKPALSKHLKVLEHAGLVTFEKKGQFVHYRLAEDNMVGKLHNMFATFCPVGSKLKKESAAKANGPAKSSSAIKDKTTESAKRPPIKSN